MNDKIQRKVLLNLENHPDDLHSQDRHDLQDIHGFVLTNCPNNIPQRNKQYCNSHQ